MSVRMKEGRLVVFMSSEFCITESNPLFDRSVVLFHKDLSNICLCQTLWWMETGDSKRNRSWLLPSEDGSG